MLPRMQPYRHLLLTRFNIVTEFAPAPQRLEDDWLHSRLEPFRQYCVPSVEAQTSPVPWLVFVDEQSPAWFKEEMESTAAITPVYLGLDGSPAAMAAAARATGLVDQPYLITSRLDSDDAIARTFLETVQSAFADQEREFVELPVGLQAYRGGIYTHLWRSNPFLSLVERIEEDKPVEGVFALSHAQVVRTQPVRTLWRSPQWLQTIHASNNESMLAGGALPLPRTRLKSFHCRWDDSPHDPLAARVGHAWRSATFRVNRKVRREIGKRTSR